MGRDAELNRLRAALDLLRAGTGGLVEIVGEPGIGKSRLLTEVAGIAPEYGVRTAAGRCDGPDGAGPGQVFAEALGEEFEAAGAAEPYGPDRPRLARRVRARLAELAPVVLLLDDLHRADPASLDLLGRLLARPPAGPVLFTCAYRPGQAPGALLAALAEAGPAALARDRIAVPPLSPADTAALLAGHPDPHPLHEAAGGNPRYLQALTGEYGGLLGEVTALPAQARAVLEAAAVLGEEFTPEDLAMAFGADAADALTLLVREDLLRAEGRLRFRHPLLRQAVYERTDPVWRLRTHRRIARELAELGAPARAIAPHLACAGNRYEPGDLRTLLEAADEVMSRSPATAVDWLAAALPLTDGPDDPPGVQARLVLIRALLLDGQITQARTVLHDLLPHVPGDARDEMITVSAQVDRLLGRIDEAASLLAGELADGRDDYLLRRELSLLRLHHSDPEGAAAEAHAAVRAARRRGDGVALAGAKTLVALAVGYQGDPRTAPGVLAGAAAAVDGLDDTSLAEDPTCLSLLGWAEIMWERFADAERHLTRGVEIGRRFGRDGTLADLYAALCYLRANTGRIAEAVAMGERAEHAAARTGSPILLSLAQAIHAVALRYCDLPRAVRLAAAAAEAARTAKESWSATAVTVVAAEVLEAAGEPDRARRTLLGLDGGAGLLGATPGCRADWLEIHTRVALACADLAWARAAADGARSIAERFALPGQRGYALRARACVLAAEGEHAGLPSLADRARACFTEAGLHTQVAETLVRTARMRPAEEARQALATARSLAAEYGAARLAEEAEREQRRLAARGPRCPGTLTRREREIAELAKTGLTSKEIAARLMVSPRTVDDHLSRVYRKLGVTSRTALAHALLRG